MPDPIILRRHVHAPLSEVWATLVDVERMPEWTPSMSSVRALEPGPLRLGGRYAIKQPGMRELEWVVTALEPESHFRWTTKAAGVTIDGDHRLWPGADGQGTELEFAITQRGHAAGLVALLTGRRTRRMVGQEIDGLKRACESSADRA